MHTSPTPISPLPLETPHPVAARQEEGEESAVHVITQTIYRPSTTFVTYVTLGSGPPTSTSNPDRGNDPAEPPPPAAAAASPTANVRDPPPDRSSGSLSSVQIGGILGGIVAFVAIALIAWFCVSQKPRRRPPPDDPWVFYYPDDYDSSTESYGNTPPPPPPRSLRPRSRMGGRVHCVPPHPGIIPTPRPPQPVLNVNRYKSWIPTYNGPPRRQQPPAPHRYRTRVP
ncbi:hypothetical protein CTA2_7589 [Colletotrichum tanaceti]|uniref:Mid2 domain-containing protein n=1 Tax=Colletotrichum tanaceti TaxID=1306861 RepID=A0A4U6XE32_9PEZI|nr:hypothetical protein CTA2_7589 [Colletotrichum tanaceti]TKW53499.1 hypothetical protein CTA1_12405 [Colletotrichum tanaceti]